MVNMFQVERNSKITRIAAMIKKTFDVGRNIDKEKLIMVVMKDLMTTRRTAVEYINTTKMYVSWVEEKGILKRTKSQKVLDIGVHNETNTKK